MVLNLRLTDTNRALSVFVVVNKWLQPAGAWINTVFVLEILLE